MKRAAILGCVGILSLVLCGCGHSGPQAGETVVPVVEDSIQWQAGKAADLAVRLQARRSDGTTRDLDFTGIRNDPVAKIVYLEGDKELGSDEVKLSHRC